MFEQEVGKTFHEVLDYCQALAKRKLHLPILAEKVLPPAAVSKPPKVAGGLRSGADSGVAPRRGGFAGSVNRGMNATATIDRSLRDLRQWLG